MPTSIANGNTADADTILRTLSALGYVTSGLDAAKTATPSVGQVYIATNANKFYFCAVANTWIPLIEEPAAVESNPASLDVVTAETSVTNDATKTTVYTYSVAGGVLSTNNLLRLQHHFYYLNNGGANSFTMTVEYGGTVLATVVHAPAQSATASYGWFTLDLKGDGATNAQKAMMLETVYLIGTTAQTINIYGTAAVDSTVAKNLLITYDHSLANAATTATTRTTTLEKYTAL